MKFLALTLTSALAVMSANADSRCYIQINKNIHEGAKITEAPDGTFWGKHFGTIHSEDASYYAAFETWLIAGEARDASTIRFDTITLVDGDRQERFVDWAVTSNVASEASDLNPMTRADCTTLEARVWDHD